MDTTNIQEDEAKKKKDADANLAIQLSEKVGNFLQPAETSDAGLIRAAVDFSTEITPEQNKIIVLLELLATDPLVSLTAKQKLRIIIDAFSKRQKYFNTKAYIMDIVRSLSWRHFVESGFISGSVSKNENK